MAGRRRGAVVDAPPDVGFVDGESPAPGRVHEATQGEDDAVPRASSGRLWSLVKLAWGLMMVIGLALGAAWGAQRYATTSPRFAIERLEVVGARRLTTDSISRQAKLEVGANIFLVDSERAEAQLLDNPWVREVTVTRRLPRVLRIELQEYEPQAIASVGPELYLVTSEGKPFKQLEPTDPYDFPVITGISPQNLARDRVREVERIQAGLEVLKLYERVPMHHAFPAQEVHVSPGGAMTLMVGQQSITVHLGKGAWRQKLTMAARVMGKLQSQGKIPGIIFADNEAHPERVVVRMR